MQGGFTVPVIPAAGFGTRFLPAAKSQPKEMLPVGRKPVVGRPFLFGTTKEFLLLFNLNSLDDLPKQEEMGALETE